MTIRLVQLLLCCLALLLNGCGLASTAAPAATGTPAPPTATVLPTSTSTPWARLVRPTFTRSTRTPTSTPAPPTSTPAPPTSTPAPPTSTPAPPPAEVRYSLPVGLPGRAPGDGFFIRHGYAVENTWFNPGFWHAGEDWYTLEGDAAGAMVYAVAAGEVVYVGANYPGRVVIVQQQDGLFAMYGHLDPAVAVQPGQQVGRGALLGTVLRRSDTVPNHLHFELRTFYTTREVNGAAPRYGFSCGVNCPPGPGYWPIGAPEHPGAMGWRNPLHVIANRALAPADGPRASEVLVVAQPVSASLTLWSAPPDGGATPAQALGTLALEPGRRLALLEAQVGPEDARGTSALAYRLWYRIETPDGRRGWVAALAPTAFETGGDGRPATVRLNLVPALAGDG